MEQNKQTIFDDAFKLIKYVNSWKKLALLFVLSSSSIALYSIYENRISLAYWGFSELGKPEIDKRQVNAQAKSLLRDTSANSVIVWDINTQSNQRHALYVSLNGRELDELEGIGDLALRAGSKQSDNVINIINNVTWCYPIVRSSDVEKMLAKSGINYMCSAKVPPSSGFFIGMITVGFTQKPDNEDYVRQRLVTAAEQIIK